MVMGMVLSFSHLPPSRLSQRLPALLQLTSEDIFARTVRIYNQLLAESPRVQLGNFTNLAPLDLARLFELYDAHFFESLLQHNLNANGWPIHFSLSRRLTRSAGMTKRFGKFSILRGTKYRFEIAISTPLLYQSFRDLERTIRVNGVVCQDRLQALQRVFEHELLHLLEMLVWGRSSCSGKNYKSLAWNLFRHPETRHDLVTQHERAYRKFDIRPGDRVTFIFQGTRYWGIVNRITQRVTILVETPSGQLYSDGKRYAKFYVPLGKLEKLSS